MRTLIAILLIVISLHAFPQYTFYTPKGSFAIEVSLENTTLKRLPMYRNAISSLVVSGNNIIGGTSAVEGLAPFVFTASITNREMTSTLDLEKVVPGQRAIQTGFARGTGETFYAGTIANNHEEGHLLEVKIDPSGNITVRDLGSPVRGEGIFALTSAAKGSILYGISYPTGIFFSYNIATRAVRKFNEIVPTNKDLSLIGEYVLSPEDYLCRALIETQQGQIIGSFPVNKIFSFSPATQKFEVYKDSLPVVWGRRVLGQAECWTKSKSGKIYGGNAGDGQLFELDPVSRSIKNLGKPVMMPRLRGLAFGSNSKLYGIAGSSPGYVHLFSYSEKKGFQDYGNPQFKMTAPEIEQGIDWRGYQIGTIAASENGKYIVMGEDEALSHLLIFTCDGE